MRLYQVTLTLSQSGVFCFLSRPRPDITAADNDMWERAVKVEIIKRARKMMLTKKLSSPEVEDWEMTFSLEMDCNIKSI